MNGSLLPMYCDNTISRGVAKTINIASFWREPYRTATQRRSAAAAKIKPPSITIQNDMAGPTVLVTGYPRKNGSDEK